MKTVRCSFCDRKSNQVKTILISKDGDSICNECIVDCKKLIKDVPAKEVPTLDKRKPNCKKLMRFDNVYQIDFKGK